MGEHGWPKADFGPVKAAGRRQIRLVEALRLPSVLFFTVGIGGRLIICSNISIVIKLIFSAKCCNHKIYA